MTGATNAAMTTASPLRTSPVTICSLKTGMISMIGKSRGMTKSRGRALAAMSAKL